MRIHPKKSRFLKQTPSDSTRHGFRRWRDHSDHGRLLLCGARPRLSLTAITPPIFSQSLLRGWAGVLRLAQLESAGIQDHIRAGLPTVEAALLTTGVELVLPSESVKKKPGKPLDLMAQLKMMLEHQQSGEMPRKLAEQMIHTQMVLAKDGFSVGGNPPYGFVRVLVDEPTGRVLEILTGGKRVRQKGCHVLWIPDPSDDGVSEDSKLRVWIMMLNLKSEGWGYKRIANHLDALNIPSPNAGKTRTDHRGKHVVEGKWNHTTVKALVENSLIIGKNRYGRRAEGKHRRRGTEGPRLLEENDRNDNGHPKVILNDPSLHIVHERPEQAKFAAEKWQQIQDGVRRNNKSQRGIARASDPAKYPLSCR